MLRRPGRLGRRKLQLLRMKSRATSERDVHMGNNARIQKDGLCYTEDDILVYNLYIARIPKHISEDNIKMRFSKYGEISSVTIEVKENIKDKRKFRYGFVNFKSAKSAAEALQNKNFLRRYYFGIVIKPADSWMQPSILEENIEKSPSPSPPSPTVQEKSPSPNAQVSEENDIEGNNEKSSSQTVQDSEENEKSPSPNVQDSEENEKSPLPTVQDSEENNEKSPPPTVQDSEENNKKSPSPNVQVSEENDNKGNNEKSSSPTAKDSEENDVEENLILILNDDCLIHIFSFLSLKEQIKLSLLCERFQNILLMLHRKSKSLNIPNGGKNLTLMETRQLISQVGDYIERLHVRYTFLVAKQRKFNYSRLLETIFSSCTNLRWVEISSITNIHLDIYTLLSTNLKFLTKVELKSCNIEDDVISDLSKLPELEYLDVSGNDGLTGRFLSDCSKLTKLNLKECRSIEPKYFSDLCKNGRLKSLNVQECYELNKQNFKEIGALENLTDLVCSTNDDEALDFCNVAGLKNLESLVIYCLPDNQSVENLFDLLAIKKENTLQELVLRHISLTKMQRDCICSLKGLKNLGLFEIELNNEFLQKIATLPNLENLSLIRCTSFTQMGIASFFVTSNKLRSIDVSFNNNINIETLYCILDKVKKSRRSSPCTFHVYKTAIRKFDLLDKNYLDCASVLPISFRTSKLSNKFV